MAIFTIVSSKPLQIICYFPQYFFSAKEIHKAVANLTRRAINGRARQLKALMIAARKSFRPFLAGSQLAHCHAFFSRLYVDTGSRQCQLGVQSKREEKH